MSKTANYKSYKDLVEKKEENNDGFICMEVQDLQHRKKILTQNHIVCIDLWADWCGPCKHIAPQFARLAQKYNSAGKCMLVKENVDLDLKRDVEITGIPAFIFYRGGRLMKTEKGEPLMVLGGDMNKIEEILTNLL